MSTMQKTARITDVARLRGRRRPLFAGWQRLSDALERWRQRRLLLALSERMLKDLALSRCDVEREAGKRWRT
jgi:uncharacterized protein YjiS (DUF1127 family)